MGMVVNKNLKVFKQHLGVGFMSEVTLKYPNLLGQNSQLVRKKCLITAFNMTSLISIANSINPPMYIMADNAKVTLDMP